VGLRIGTWTQAMMHERAARRLRQERSTSQARRDRSEVDNKGSGPSTIHVAT